MSSIGPNRPFFPSLDENQNVDSSSPSSQNPPIEYPQSKRIPTTEISPYTCSNKLAIEGGSNGGLVVGALSHKNRISFGL